MHALARLLVVPPFLLGLVILSSHSAVAAPPASEAQKDYAPSIAAASDEAEQAIAGFKIPESLKIELFAAEPLVANPVAFWIDEQGRIYVAETFRQEKGVEDNRRHMNWLDDDLALQTVQQRLKMFEKHLREKVAEYAKEHDRIRVLEDRDGDGRADHSSVFADGFNGILDGTGAGVIARRGDVYYTCIPHLWLLRDEDGDGRAEVRRSLHSGYGVRVAFRGHDMHGLRFGPDGKLYYSIGDRGYHVETEGRMLSRPDTGAVFRCNPDGSDLEVVAYGLRNPQELAFDQYGNLFTGDNNSDSGDKARWVYVVEGGDSGWRMYYQYLKDRGPWNREKLWHPYHPEQPAYIVPPIANFADGPSGLAYDPGVGLPEKYRNHFFLCDFRGGPANSGIRSFAVKPKGSTFELVDDEQFAWSILATDVDFGPDGSMYVSDWVDGWTGLGKGRLYRIFDPDSQQDPVIAAGRKIMAEGFQNRTPSELAGLLRHPDQRIRQEAQFALAERGEEAVAIFREVAANREHQLARIHAIWGLGQIGRSYPAALEPVLALWNDDDAEIRAQAARVLGDGRYRPGAGRLLDLLKDSSPRVQFFAALGLGKVGDVSVMPAVLQLLETNNDADPMLRHAGVMALAGAGDVPSLVKAAGSSSPAARLGVLLALRRHESAEIARFLNDPEPRLVDEAARAIHDLPIEGAVPRLAELAERTTLNEETWRRVISANFRLGEAEHARRVATIAGRGDLSDAIRIEALNALADWAQPSGRDRVLGAWRPLAPRPQEIAAAALPVALGGVFSGPDAVREVGVKVAAGLGVKEVGPVLLSLVTDANRSAAVRVEALRGLESLKDARLRDAMQAALADAEPVVRAAGQKVLAAINPGEAITVLRSVLESGSQHEKQQGFATLAAMQVPAADALLAEWLDRLLAGTVAPEVHLDLLEAAAKRPTNGIPEKLQRFEASRRGDDPLSAWRESLVGGDASRGRSIFFERAQVSCVRCHKIDGQGGDVGPDLSRIASDQPRESLLEAIVDPNRKIAKGFETAVLVTDLGKVHVGIIKSENDDTIELMTAEGKLLTLNKEEIEERASGKSAMPEDLVKQLSKSDLRDLVEFLSRRKAR